jgi:hypothetical protein
MTTIIGVVFGDVCFFGVGRGGTVIILKALMTREMEISLMGTHQTVES